MRFYCINQALNGYVNTMARMQQSKEAVETGNAEIGRVRQFWRARNKHVPQEYRDAETAVHSETEPVPAPRHIEEEVKSLQQMLEYAARFRTDDGMTAYLKRNAAKLPEDDCKIVEDLLKESPEDIRNEIGRIVSA